MLSYTFSHNSIVHLSTLTPSKTPLTHPLTPPFLYLQVVLMGGSSIEDVQPMGVITQVHSNTPILIPSSSPIFVFLSTIAHHSPLTTHHPSLTHHPSHSSRVDTVVMAWDTSYRMLALVLVLSRNRFLPSTSVLTHALLSISRNHVLIPCMSEPF